MQPRGGARRRGTFVNRRARVHALVLLPPRFAHVPGVLVEIFQTKRFPEGLIVVFEQPEQPQDPVPPHVSR